MHRAVSPSSSDPGARPLSPAVDPMAFIESAEDAIVFDDLERNVVFANRAFRRLFCLGDADHLKRIDDYVAPEWHEAQVARHARRMAGEDVPLTYEFEAVRRDGSRLWVEASVASVFRDGAPVGSCAILRDITERREREKAAEGARQQYRSLFEQAFDAIIVFEPEEQIVLDVNPRACALYGRTRDEFIGMSLRSISLHPHEERAALDRLCRGEPLHDQQTVQLHKDGTELYVECNASLIEYRGCDAVLTINRDITERRRLQQQLTHAEKMQGIGRLAAGVAHEFNNVLTAILGTAEALLDDVTQPGARALIEQMIGRGKAGADVTRELLALSRKPTGGMQPIAIDTCVEAMGSWLGALLGEEVDLRLELRAPGAFVSAHPGQIEQVVLNLAINARDAMNGAGVLRLRTFATELVTPLRVTTHRLDRGPYGIVEVWDTGPGIPEDSMAKVFEPFYTTKAQGEGTGLGLSMVYSIVDQLGGAIEVRNEGGACFTIHLPLSPEGADQDEPHREANQAGGGETILLVDDETIIVESLARGLGNAGYHVLTASDAARARQLLDDHAGRIDMLLTDLSMPGEGGLELARHALTQLEGLRVMLMSGYAERALPPELAQASFMQKPFTRELLLRRIRELLDRDPSRR